MTALYIRDEGVAALADRLTRETRAASKTEAVRRALLEALAHVQRSRPASQRLAKYKAMADQIGTSTSQSDYQAFSDDGWEI